MKTLDEVSLVRWQQLAKESQADTTSWQQYAAEDEQRKTICKGMVELLNRFLREEVGTDGLREMFDKKTRNEWRAFGFKGMSGAMFLNMLVKHMPDEAALAAMLRSVLPVPKDIEDGRTRLRTFFDGLQGYVVKGSVTKAQVQVARAPFFISAWWHVQDTEHWPVFYVSGRNVLQQQPDYDAPSDLVDDYFGFRDYFLALAAALKVNSWTMEHILDWQNRLGGKKIGPDKKKNGKKPTDDEDDEEGEAQPTHVQTQWLLAKIGPKLGCKVWIAANDQKREWKGERLGDLSVDALPNLGLDDESQKAIRLIDVVWLKGNNQVAAAFEIEQTTSIFSGLLRMSDLVSLSPNLNFPLYLVAPKERLEKVRKQLARPTFQALELHKRCGYFSCEELVQAADSILQWASAPAAINKLAKWVEDTKS